VFCVLHSLSYIRNLSLDPRSQKVQSAVGGDGASVRVAKLHLGYSQLCEIGLYLAPVAHRHDYQLIRLQILSRHTLDIFRPDFLDLFRQSAIVIEG